MSDNESLATIRAQIDTIDEAMHRLLMQRGEIINRLVEVKKTDETGQAFRPGREAQMMQALSDRHYGLLPLPTVENIWRIIISTFTFIQAPYAVHADESSGEIKDSARFHFGFNVPYNGHQTTEAVIKAVMSSRGDVGLIHVHQNPTNSRKPWWQECKAANAPKIIARLPFINHKKHVAGAPVFVISKPLKEAAIRDVIIYSIENWDNTSEHMLKKTGCEKIAYHEAENTGLVACSSEKSQAMLNEIFAGNEKYHNLIEIGSHPAPYQPTSGC